MQPTLPDPHAVAKNLADYINAHRAEVLEVPIDRIIADSPQLDRAELLQGIEAFHAERMGRVPSASNYPESPLWVAQALAVDRELKSLANLSDREMAIFRSLSLYTTFRGMRRCAAVDEKCRLAYLPDSDRGPISIGNTDDPLTHWKPAPPPKQFPVTGKISAGGVGSGLHIDEEPDDLFPLPVMEMLAHYADDTPSAVEFLTRYTPFWGRCNILVFDDQQQSAAIEKCSFKYIDVFPPDKDGRSHVSGMTCRDNTTQQGRHQEAMRLEYLDLFNLPHDGPDMAFWNASRGLEKKLDEALKKLGTLPKLDDLLRLFLTRYPEGLNKWGLKPHPDLNLVGFTLQTHVLLLREKTYLRWQRSEDGKSYPSEPEVFRFAE